MSRPEPAPDALAVLLDRQAIADVCTGYVIALDIQDWDGVAACYTDDAVFIHPKGQVDGPTEIVARAQGALVPLDASQHLTGSHTSSVSGDEAVATTYFQAQHVRSAAANGSLYTIAGTYQDRLRRTDAGWRIYERTQTYAWKSGNPDVIVR